MRRDVGAPEAEIREVPALLVSPDIGGQRVENCYVCNKTLHEDDDQIRAQFEVPDLGESGDFYFCSQECLMPWVHKTRQKMIDFHGGEKE